MQAENDGFADCACQQDLRKQNWKWRYFFWRWLAVQGRGLKQLTGRGNYQAFADDHKIFWGEAIDFVVNPELLNNPIYAVRSGVYFWISKELLSIADAGDQFNNVDKITAVINLGTDSYGARRRHFFKDLQR